MHKTTRALLGATSLLLSATVLAAAQEPPAGPPRPRAEAAPRPRPAMDRMGMRGGPARMLLAMRDQLALTDEQVRRLEALAATQRDALRPNEPAMLRARADLMEATQKDDLVAARAAMDRMARLRTDAAMAQLQARKAARDVLTPEQRTRLEDRGAMAMRRMPMMRERREMRGPRGEGRPAPREQRIREM